MDFGTHAYSLLLSHSTNRSVQNRFVCNPQRNDRNSCPEYATIAGLETILQTSTRYYVFP
jgi:hypothetical protein